MKMMEWNTFVEYNKIMLVLAGIIFVGSFISSFIWLKHYERKKKLKGDMN